MHPVPTPADSPSGEAGRGATVPEGPRTRWPGESWPPGVRIALVVAVTIAYALAFLPLYQAGGRLGAAPLSSVVVAGAAALLGLRGGLLAAAAMLPLHTLLLNLAGEPGWDVVLRGGGLGSASLFVTGGAVGFLRDLARRVEAQAREIAAQRTL